MNCLLVLGGTPPREELLTREAQQHDVIIAVDHGLDVLSAAGLPVDVLIGDLDSIQTSSGYAQSVVHLTGQNSTDLQKALEYISLNLKITGLTILGSSGGRTDHLINNMHICAGFDPTVPITLKNDHQTTQTKKREFIYRITPNSDPDLTVAIGATVSVFTLSHVQNLSVSGLKWNIRVLDSATGLISQSNQSCVDKLSVTLGSGCVYIAVYQ